MSNNTHLFAIRRQITNNLEYRIIATNSGNTSSNEVSGGGAQAMQVRLGAAERAAAAMVPRLRELLLDARVLCRALPPANASAATPAAPHVELFVRIGPQSILASVNNSILMEYEYL